MPYTYDYPRPAAAADCLVFHRDAAPGSEWHILLIQRDRPPYEGCWAFPGGFMEIDETIDETARRELEEETGLRDVAFEQMHAFSRPDRDPRGRVLTVAFCAVVPDRDAARLHAADDARDARWFPLSALPPLAFDHEEMMAMAKERFLKGQESSE